MTRSPKILFAWELGANFGHASEISQVVAAMNGRAEITVCASDPAVLRRFLPDLNLRLLPAPQVPLRSLAKGEHPGLCYPGALRQHGWDDTGKLGAILECWDALLEACEADIVVAQAAPGALLACRGKDVKTVALGGGYDAPPRSAPMPCYVPDSEHAVVAARRQEQETLAVINKCLTARRVAPLRAFCEMLQTHETLLACYPETDHFAPREMHEASHPAYCGALLSTDVGRPTHWRDNGRPKVLAYLRPDTAQFKPAIAGLSEISGKLDLVLALPGLDPALADRLRSDGTQVVDGPVHLDPLLAECDLGISHGTAGIGQAFVSFGVPQLGIPSHQEQLLFSQAVARAGLGLGIAGRFEKEQMVAAVQRALQSTAIRAAVQRTADQIIANGLNRAADICADRILQLVT